MMFFLVIGNLHFLPLVINLVRGLSVLLIVRKQLTLAYVLIFIYYSLLVSENMICFLKIIAPSDKSLDHESC